MFGEAMQFASIITPNGDNIIKIKTQSRKILLFHENRSWVKRNSNENFYTSIGCFDGAETCELVGSYVLSKLNSIFDKKIVGLTGLELEFSGIYRIFKKKIRE